LSELQKMAEKVKKTNAKIKMRTKLNATLQIGIRWRRFVGCLSDQIRTPGAGVDRHPMKFPDISGAEMPSLSALA
jgi:hypothetical protein